MYSVYIIYSPFKNVFYKGCTSNLENRLLKHNSGASNYTSSVSDWQLVYSKVYETKTEALREEKRLKKLNRSSLERLIQNKNP